MSRLVKEKRGQFVIIAALLIAALTLATTISIHNITIHRQSITYQPVDEYLLGVTSDMNRVMTSTLASYTDGILNQGLTEAEADAYASQSITAWESSVLSSYSSYGLRMNDPLVPLWNYLWEGTTAYSFSYATYNIDIDSYGFKGWMGRSYKYVQLQIFPMSITNDSSTTSFDFMLKESAVSDDAAVPITDLESKPDLEYFHVGNYSLGEPFLPADDVSLQYFGNGNYRVTFNQLVDMSAPGIRLDLATPVEKIWVSANYFSGINDWSTLHLVSGRILQPNYLYTPGDSAFYAPPLNQGNPSVDITTPPAVLTPTIQTAPLINMTFYLASVPPRAAKTLSVELGFIYDSTYYLIGTAIIDISGSTVPLPYSVSIGVGGTDFGFGICTIPESSSILLTLTVTFEGPPGSGKVYFDGSTPSQIDLY